MTTCPQCNGVGRFTSMFPLKNPHFVLDCDLCSATGKVSDEQIQWREKGSKFRDARIDRVETLRDFARRHSLDVSDVSKAERGVIDPKMLEGL